MPLPKAKVKEVLGWLVKAKWDLTIAGMNLASEPAITDNAMLPRIPAEVRPS